ncbi:hypothetical protein [Reyranella sp.]|jgi:hypothetical protein|uniref:hypothetical protein n=1 Tax=Reyranella sp. TaxID=1929291 RepID=UPI003D0AD105
MSNPKTNPPLFVNVQPARLPVADAAKRLDRLREAGAAAKAAVDSLVKKDNQRRSALAESVTDRAMRTTIRRFTEE